MDYGLIDKVQLQIRNPTTCSVERDNFDYIITECSFESLCFKNLKDLILNLISHGCNKVTDLNIEYECISKQSIFNEFRVFPGFDVLAEVKKETFIKSLDLFSTVPTLDHKITCLIECKQIPECGLIVFTNKKRTTCELHRQIAYKYVKNATVTNFWMPKPLIFQRKGEDGHFPKLRLYKGGVFGYSILEYWPINNNTNNLLGNEKDLAPYSAPRFVSDRKNVQGGAFRITSRASSLVAIIDRVNSLPSEFTITSWVKFEDNTTDQGIFYMDETDQNGLNTWSLFLQDTSLIIVLKTQKGMIKSNTPLHLHKWYHLAISFSRTFATIYVDGLAEGSGALEDKLYYNGAVNLHFGVNIRHERLVSRNVYSTTDFDEIKIFDQAMSAKEVTDDMNGQNDIDELNFDKV